MPEGLISALVSSGWQCHSVKGQHENNAYTKPCSLTQPSPRKSSLDEKAIVYA